MSAVRKKEKKWNFHVIPFGFSKVNREKLYETEKRRNIFILYVYYVYEIKPSIVHY